MATETKTASKESINSLKESLQNPSEFKSKLKKFVDLESKNLSGELHHVKELANYLTTNWKKVLPTVAALALAGHIIKSKGKKVSKKTAGATKKAKTKKTAKKSRSN